MAAVFLFEKLRFSFVLLVVFLWLGNTTALTDSNGNFPANELVSLNKAVNGRLFRGTPVSLPCFTLYNGQPNVVSNASCSVVQAGYTTPEFRAPQFGSYMQVRESHSIFDVINQRLPV